jgi:hypothetical protein
MKGHYLVMDNAPMHTPVKVNGLVQPRGFQCLYLSPYCCITCLFDLHKAALLANFQFPIGQKSINVGAKFTVQPIQLSTGRQCI